MSKNKFSINGFIFYGRQKLYCLQKIAQLKSPRNDIEITVLHSLYLIALFSMTEKIPGIKRDTMSDYQKYAMCLRDAFVHRGYRVMEGHGENNFVLGDVADRGKTMARPKEFIYFGALFKQLERDFNQQIYNHAIVLVPLAPERFSRQEYIKQIEASFMPDFAKHVALSIDDETMQQFYNQIHASLSEQLKEIFLYEKP